MRRNLSNAHNRGGTSPTVILEDSRLPKKLQSSQIGSKPPEKNHATLRTLSQSNPLSTHKNSKRTARRGLERARESQNQQNVDLSEISNLAKKVVIVGDSRSRESARRLSESYFSRNQVSRTGFGMNGQKSGYHSAKPSLDLNGSKFSRASGFGINLGGFQAQNPPEGAQIGGLKKCQKPMKDVFRSVRRGVMSNIFTQVPHDGGSGRPKKLIISKKMIISQIGSEFCRRRSGGAGQGRATSGGFIQGGCASGNAILASKGENGRFGGLRKYGSSSCILGSNQAKGDKVPPVRVDSVDSGVKKAKFNSEQKIPKNENSTKNDALGSHRRPPESQSYQNSAVKPPDSSHRPQLPLYRKSRSSSILKPKQHEKIMNSIASVIQEAFADSLKHQEAEESSERAKKSIFKKNQKSQKNSQNQTEDQNQPPKRLSQGLSKRSEANSSPGEGILKLKFGMKFIEKKGDFRPKNTTGLLSSRLREDLKSLRGTKSSEGVIRRREIEIFNLKKMNKALLKRVEILEDELNQGSGGRGNHQKPQKTPQMAELSNISLRRNLENQIENGSKKLLKQIEGVERRLYTQFDSKFGQVEALKSQIFDLKKEVRVKLRDKDRALILAKERVRELLNVNKNLKKRIIGLEINNHKNRILDDYSPENDQIEPRGSDVDSRKAWNQLKSLKKSQSELFHRNQKKGDFEGFEGSDEVNALRKKLVNAKSMLYICLNRLIF